MKKSIYLLLLAMLFLFGCSNVESPMESEAVIKRGDFSSTAAYPISRYTISIDEPNGDYFATDDYICLQWNQISPAGCPDFERYRVYLNNFK